MAGRSDAPPRLPGPKGWVPIGLGMALFLSTFVNKVDRKGRVSVPAAFRVVLTDEGYSGAILFPSNSHAAIEGCGMAWMKELVARIEPFEPFSEQMDTFAYTMFARTHQLAFDPDGRVHLPPPLIEHAELKESAAFVGRGSRFQIWDPEKFATVQEEAHKRAKADPQTLKLRREESDP